MFQLSLKLVKKGQAHTVNFLWLKEMIVILQKKLHHVINLVTGGYSVNLCCSSEY